MNNKPTYFRLEFTDTDTEHPINPMATISAKFDGTYKFLTASLTESVFDKCIEQLVDELEYIRKEGKMKFEAAKKSRV